MKKVIVIIAVSVMSISLFGLARPKPVHATIGQPPPCGQGEIIQGGVCVAGTNTTGVNASNPSRGGPAYDQQAAIVDPAGTSGGCGVSHPIDCTMAAIANAILDLVALLTHLGGFALNFAMEKTVVGMKDLVNSITALNDTWGTIRDIANMGFIFVLLYTAIMTIIGRQGYSYQKTVVNMIIAALLINFSLFFTQVVIDAGNVTALLFYKALVPAGTDTAVGISGDFVQALKLTTIWSNPGAVTPATIITVGVIGSIVLLIAAFCFFAVAIMLAIRFAMLIFLMILSPLAFVGNVLPNVKDQIGNFWTKLVSMTFWPTIYLALTWVTLSIVNSSGFQTAFGGGSFAAGTTGSVSAAGIVTPPSDTSLGVFLNFIIVVVFMIASIVISKSFGDKFGFGVNKLTNWAMGAAPGAFGMLGRNSFGRGANALLNSEAGEKLRERANQKGVRAWAARRALYTSDAARKGSFDFRAAKVGGFKIGESISAQAGFGKAGGKGGFAKANEERAKKEEDRTKLRTEPSNVYVNDQKLKLEALKNKEDEARKEATKKVEAELPKPARLVELERNIRINQQKADDQNASPAIRDLAQGRADNFKKEAAPLQTEYERNKKQAVDKLMSANGIGTKVKEAQDKVDKLSGVKKEEVTNRQKALDTEKREALANDPNVKKQKELEEKVAKLTEMVAESSGNMKNILDKELATKQEELALSKKQLANSQKLIEENFQQRREAIKQTEGIGDIRKAAAAVNMANPGPISTDRVLLVAMVKQSSKLAAANLRKGKKPLKDQIKAILDEEGGGGKDKEGEGKPKEEGSGGGEKKEEGTGSTT